MAAKTTFVLPSGWVSGIAHHPSTHFNARPQGCLPHLIVLHHISLPAGVFGGNTVDDLFMGRLVATTDPALAEVVGLRVSSHFFVRRTGEVIQYVSATDRAWHAGVSRFEGVENCNDFSLGIEIEGTGSVPYCEGQYRAVARLIRVLARAYPIRAITGHEFIAPGRKSDPGPSFDWGYLRTLLPRRLRFVTCPQ